jgi:tetratricopeptide (TPR) repeat protein
MSMRLALVPGSMDVARRLARSGRTNDARSQALRLLRRSDLTVAEAADANRVIGGLDLDSEAFASARRHFRASLALEPNHARTWFQAGLACERDPYGDDRRAARCYRKAMRLAEQNFTYRAAFGRAAIRCDHVKRGVRELLQCAEAALKDASLLEVVVEGLLEAGRTDAANRIVTQARFSCPGASGIRRLQDRVRYEAARRNQRRGINTQDAGSDKDVGGRLIPFLRIARSGTGGMTPAATVRSDVASFPRPHLPRLRSRTDR